MKTRIGYPKPKKRKNHPSYCHDIDLLKLWRACVKVEWGEKCVFQSISECAGEVQCHHIKRRNIRPLRYSPANGIPVCEYHHTFLRYDAWKRKIESLVGAERMEWLDMMEQKKLPDFLIEKGMTRGEWLIETRDNLRRLLAEFEVRR